MVPGGSLVPDGSLGPGGSLVPGGSLGPGGSLVPGGLLFFHCLSLPSSIRKILFLDPPEAYSAKDNWPPETERR